MYSSSSQQNSKTSFSIINHNMVIFLSCIFSFLPMILTVKHHGQLVDLALYKYFIIVCCSVSAWAGSQLQNIRAPPVGSCSLGRWSATSVLRVVRAPCCRASPAVSTIFQILPKLYPVHQ